MIVAALDGAGVIIAGNDEGAATGLCAQPRLLRRSVTQVPRPDTGCRRCRASGPP